MNYPVALMVALILVLVTADNIARRLAERPVLVVRPERSKRYRGYPTPVRMRKSAK